MQHQIHVYLLLIIYFQLNLKFLLQHDKLQQNVDILVQLFEFPIEPTKSKCTICIIWRSDRFTSSACLQASKKGLARSTQLPSFLASTAKHCLQLAKLVWNICWASYWVIWDFSKKKKGIDLHPIVFQDYLFHLLQHLHVLIQSIIRIKLFSKFECILLVFEDQVVHH
jgi:hypothetical protein